MMLSTMFNLLAQATMPSTNPATQPVPGSEHGFFYPIQASTIAADVDPLAWFIHGISIFFTVGIIAATVWFVIKYRASVHPVPKPPGHNNVLEVIWTGIPAIIVFICFFWGFRVYMKMTVDQPGANKVDAIGFQWDWQFRYNDPKTGRKVTMKELWLVKDKPVEITMSSNDVIHALFIPVMRMKKDVVPGRYNTMVFEPNREGIYEVFCAEYCGDSHSKMHSLCHVVSQQEYDAQVQRAADVFNGPNGPRPLDEVGKDLASLNGCFSCHSSDGSAGTGPTWRDLYGATNHALADGTSITVDDNYIHESIRTPNAKVRQGFGPPSAMNPFPPTQVSDRDIEAIIAYQKSISQFAPKAAGTPNSDKGDKPQSPTTAKTPPPAAAGARTDNAAEGEKK